jgi:hypothetical protein
MYNLQFHHIIYENSYILTQNGYYNIEDLYNDYTDNNNLNSHKQNKFKIWNGNDWVLIKIKQNTEDFNIIYKILLSDGCELLCSKNTYLNIIKINEFDLSQEINNIKIVDLKIDYLLNTYNFPLIDGDCKDNILYPYTHGYYCGCMNKLDGHKDELRFESNLIYINLIVDKQKLKSKIEICGKYSFDKNKNSLTGLLKVDMEKNIQTPINGSIENKLLWLSGLIDNNGFITKLCDAKYLNISVLSKKFAMEIKFLFNTLGINPNIYLKNNIRKFKTDSGKIDEIIKHCWVIKLNADETNKIFLKSEFDLKIYYLNYDKNSYSIDQDINRFIYIKKINQIKLKKDSYVIENINSCVINGVLIQI